MAGVSEVQDSTIVPRLQQKIQTNISEKQGDSIFACAARKAGLNGLADFLRDDWSANMARKTGHDKFADWIENKNSAGQEESGNLFEKIARAVVKHPVLAIAAIALTAFAGKKLYNMISAKSKVVAETVTDVSKPAMPALQETIVPAPIDAIPHDIESVNKMIEEGLDYERNIHFKNLEIFQNSTDKERELMLTYFRITKKEKDLLLFASGNKPAMLEGIHGLNDGIFNSLRSDSVGVAGFFTKIDDNGNLIINNQEARRIIGEHLAFFQERLGLPSTATVEEIFKGVSKCSFSPLRDASGFADLRGLLLGQSKYDALHAQLVADLRKRYKLDFYSVCRPNLETYKDVLKKMVMNENFTYGKMDSTFQADLIKKIDTLTLRAFKNLIVEPVHVFPNAVYEQQQLEGLRNLALKLKQAQETGASIGFV